ncbi:MAG: diguanylate cyclase [Betaproteobacteria bacterium]|nr:diguanylate cyclase [Betaproteobacteria bacterium]
MWAAIGEGGVAKRVDRRWVPFALPNSGIVRVIAPRASGGFWIGGERGVLAIDVTDGVPNLVASGVALKGPVWFIREDADRRLWVGSESGTHLREADGRWRHLEAEFKLPPRITWTVFRDKQGVHWIGGRNGLIRFDDKGVRVYGPAEGLALATVRAIAEDRTGALWIATPGGGLQRFRANGNGGRGEFDTLTTKDGLNSDSVMTVYADRAGNIWAGMAGGGVARLSDPPIASYRKKDGLTGDWIWTAHEDAASDIWLGTNGNGVSVLRDVAGQVRVVRRIPGTVNGLDTVWSMHAWDPGRAIVSATQGIGRIERDDRVTWLYRLADGENPPRVFLRTRDGKLLVAKGRKLFEVRTEGVVDAGHPEFKAVVSSLLETPEGDLIAGTRQGSIQRLDRRANKLTDVADNLGGAVYALQRDAAGRLWASANGIYIRESLANAAREVKIGPANGFPDRNSNDLILPADGSVWMGTNRGILVASQQELLGCLDNAQCKPRLRALDERDGLITAETNGGAQPNGVRDRAGRIWLPAINGIMRIDPAAALPLTPLPAVVVNALRADRVDFETDRALPPNTRDVEVDYTLPELTLPKQVRFRYRLLPDQPEWQEAGARRTAYFSRLKPGSYRFEVQAARLHGDWPQEVATREFALAAAWYQTWWARAFAAVVLFVALLAAPWIRIATLRRRKKLLESEVANRTAELAAVNRQLDVMARTDVLTGIANRREFGERLAQRCREYDGYGVLAVMIADIDDFKAYNDHYGHPAGDACLHDVAQALRAALQGADALVSRYGGEEFAVVARVPDPAAAATLAGALVAAVRAMGRAHAHSRAAKVVTLSLGYCVAEVPGPDPAAVLQCADAALYRAKEAGRDRAVAGEKPPGG